LAKSSSAERASCQDKLTEIEDDPVRNMLQDFVSTVRQGREHVRKAERLAAYLNALRPLRPHILQPICIAATVIFWLGQ
jgi:hypothetical protein